MIALTYVRLLGKVNITLKNKNYRTSDKPTIYFPLISLTFMKDTLFQDVMLTCNIFFHYYCSVSLFQTELLA